MIHLRGVSKQFEGTRKVTALERLDLDIGRGEMVSIVGPSGSGKSTLLNLIGGLDRPTEGEIEIDGETLSALSDDGLTRVRRDKIGFIFQFFNLLPTLSCLENVSLPLHLRGYAGEVVTRGTHNPLSFTPDRGFAKSFVGRAALTIDTNRSLAVETAVRSAGSFVRLEYSQTFGQHWRVTPGVAWIRGDMTDFLGQYHRNSYASLAVRYSF